MVEKVKLQIDTIGYDSKQKVKNDIRIVKNRVQCSSPVDISIDDFIQAIRMGKTFSPAVMIGKKANDFLEQQLFAVDIDNENKNIPILQIQDALEICKKNSIPVAFYYHSFSYTTIKPKYRIVFILENPVTNINIRNTIAKNLCSLFEQADKSCVNADRIFFGTNKEVVKCDIITKIDFEKILGLFAPKIENTAIEKNYDNELEKLKANFDFCNFLEKRNGPVYSNNGNYIMFENCEICGHHRDLVYYKTTNTFYCFGANGNIGGTIIDYIMKVDNLNSKQAIDKFKYELCGLKKQGPTTELISAKDLLAMNLEKPYVVVENMLCQGLTILAGPPKIGKSWLCLDLCISVCSGQPFLEFKTNKSDCVYLALEDSNNRLQDRISKVLSSKEVPEGFYTCIYIDPLNEGLLEELEKQLQEHPNIKLIIIDTFQKIRGYQGKTESTYQYDYKEVGKLKSFADNHKICILVIHHLRKQKDSDVFNQISGSTGLTGAADTSIIIQKKDNQSSEAILAITGRDVESTEKLLLFDKFSCKWNVVGDASDFDDQIDRFDYENNPIVITIKKLLEENPEGIKITASQLLKKVFEVTGNYPKQDKPNTLSREINNNLQFKLLKFDGIYYEKPNENGGSCGRQLYFSKPKKSNI